MRLVKYDILDISKFMAALFVVGIHSGPFYSYSSELQYYVFSVFGRLAVPFFFIISAFFLTKSIKKRAGTRQENSVVWHYMKRILMLYFAWYLIYIPMMLTKAISAGLYFHNMPAAILKRFVTYFFIGSTFRGSWYLTASVFGALFVFVICKKLTDKQTLLATLPIFILVIISTEFLGAFNGTSIGTVMMQLHEMGIHFSTNILASPIYYALGRIIATNEEKIRTYHFWQVLAVTIISIIALLLEGKSIKALGIAFSTDQFLMLVPTGFLLVVLLLHLTSIKIPNTSWYRSLSTFIYMSQFGIIWIRDLVTKTLNVQMNPGIG